MPKNFKDFINSLLGYSSDVQQRRSLNLEQRNKKLEESSKPQNIQKQKILKFDHKRVQAKGKQNQQTLNPPYPISNQKLQGDIQTNIIRQQAQGNLPQSFQHASQLDSIEDTLQVLQSQDLSIEEQTNIGIKQQEQQQSQVYHLSTQEFKQFQYNIQSQNQQIHKKVDTQQSLKQNLPFKNRITQNQTIQQQMVRYSKTQRNTKQQLQYKILNSNNDQQDILKDNEANSHPQQYTKQYQQNLVPTFQQYIDQNKSQPRKEVQRQQGIINLQQSQTNFQGTSEDHNFVSSRDSNTSLQNKNLPLQDQFQNSLNKINSQFTNKSKQNIQFNSQNPYISLSQTLKLDTLSNFETLLQTTADDSWDNKLGGTTDISLLMQNKGVQVMKKLYLGGQAAEENINFIIAKDITHVLQVGGELTCTHSQQLKYLKVTIQDSKTEDIIKYLPQCFKFINEARYHGQSVLVHCLAGISRSASVCIAYIMYRKKVSFEEAYKRVKRVRQGVRPNDNFIRQLKDFEQIDYDFSRWQGPQNIQCDLNGPRYRQKDQFDIFDEVLQQDSDELNYNGYNL